MKIITVPVHSFRNLDIPFLRNLDTALDMTETDFNKQKMSYAIIKVKDIPFEALDEWRETINPRWYNENVSVVKDIIDTYQNSPELFLLKNRWITILCEKFEFDKENGKISLYFNDRIEDEPIHWILDWWHTFKTLYNQVEQNDNQELSNNAYVKFEIIEGIANRSEMIEIVAARNSSRNVANEDIQNLENSFEPIKDVLKNKDYTGKIAYKSSELDGEWEKKPISIRDILSLMICFDKRNYKDGNSNPITAYSAKGGVVKHFGKNKENKEMIGNIAWILPEILELSDTIYYEMGEVWNTDLGWKFGKVTWIGVRSRGSEKLHFIDKETKWTIPWGYIYPILSSFRFLVDETNWVYKWKENPINFWKKHKGELVNRMKDEILRARNPNMVWKDTLVWKSCYEQLQIIKLLENQENIGKSYK